MVQKVSREEFVQLLADKAHILKKHLKTTQNDLSIMRILSHAII